MPSPAPGDGADGGGHGAHAGTGPPALLGVGRIVKPHGLRGDVIVSLTTNRDERVAVGSVLTADDGRTFEVVRSSPTRGRYIVTFAGVAGIDAAEALRDTAAARRRRSRIRTPCGCTTSSAPWWRTPTASSSAG